jgi:hypothetical protein
MDKDIETAIERFYGQDDFIFLGYETLSSEAKSIKVYFIQTTDVFLSIRAYVLCQISETKMWTGFRKCHRTFHLPNFRLTHRKKTAKFLWLNDFYLLNEPLPNALWTYLMKKNIFLRDYCLKKMKTKHRSFCSEEEESIQEFCIQENNKGNEITCLYCGVSINIKWRRNCTNSNYKIHILWTQLWNSENSLIYWIPEEVLLDVIYIYNMK